MEDRRTYIGGSDVASVVAAPGAYYTSFELWQLKTGRRRPDAGNEAMAWGRRLEPIILTEWYDRTGRAPVHMGPGGWNVGATVRHPRWPFLAANVDGIGKDGEGLVVVDAKNTRRYGLGRSGEVADVDAGEVPAAWWLQLHHYAWMLGIGRAEVAALVDGADFRVLVVDLDLPWYEAAIVPQLVEFWGYVEAGTEPPHREFAQTGKTRVEIDAEGACARYVRAAAAAKAAEAEKDAARDDVLRALAAAGDPARARAGSFNVSAYATRAERIDVAALRADLPDVAARYTVTSSPTATVRITGGK